MIMRLFRSPLLILFYITASILVCVPLGCAIGSHGSTVDGKYSVPEVVVLSGDVPPELQPYLPKFEQVLGYYGLKVGATDDPRAFKLHLAYSEVSGDPKISVSLSQYGKPLVEVIDNPRRWVPWGWFTTPSDKQKLIAEVADTAVQDWDNDLQGFMQEVRIDNEPRAGEKPE